MRVLSEKQVPARRSRSLCRPENRRRGARQLVPELFTVTIPRNRRPKRLYAITNSPGVGHPKRQQQNLERASSPPLAHAARCSASDLMTDGFVADEKQSLSTESGCRLGMPADDREAVFDGGVEAVGVVVAGRGFAYGHEGVGARVGGVEDVE
jgi:hypothetical protein